jgi:O-antigen/teichoic acid export membrane protein
LLPRELARRAIDRDVTVSHLLGPVRILLPTVAVMATYRVLVHRFGLEVVGVWSLLTTVVAYTGLLDIGFTSAMARGIADESSPITPARLAAWRGSALWVYVWGGAVAALVGGLAGGALDWFGVPPNLIAEMRIGVVLLITATVFQLLARMDLGVFRANHQTYVEQWALSATTAATYVIGLLGALAGHPISSLAIGSLLANFGLWAWARRRARHQFRALYEAMASVRRPEGVSGLRDLLANGKHFFSLSVVFLIREPVFRLVIAALLGASALGVYDVANRVPMLIRELGASGSQALFAGLARMEPSRHAEEIVRVMKSAVFYLFAIGGTGLALYAVARGLVLGLWLGIPVLADLRSASLLLAVWWGITLINVPFFWLLQARRLERALATSVWVHTASLVIVLAAGRAVLHSLSQFITIWIMTGLATQVFIYIVAERETGLTRKLLLDRSVVKYVITTVSITVLALWGGSRVAEPVASRPEIVVMGCWLVLYSVLCGPMLWRMRPKRVLSLDHA